MSELDRRLGRIEALLGDEDCICREGQYAVACVGVEDGWTEAQVQEAESRCGFDCPSHGLQMPKSIVRLSPVDQML